MIHFQNVCKAFADKTVLNNVNISVAAGEKLAVCGASGSGKTTLLNLAMGLLQPDEGKILLRADVRMAAVFQEDRLIEHLNAVENVAIAAKNCEKHLVVTALKQVDMNEIQKPVCKLSGGQKRRVAIVRAALARPQMLLLDEPFKGLDAETRKKTADLLRKNCAEAAVILVSHDTDDIELMGIKRVISVLNTGLVCEA